MSFRGGPRPAQAALKAGGERGSASVRERESAGVAGLRLLRPKLLSNSNRGRGGRAAVEEEEEERWW